MKKFLNWFLAIILLLAAGVGAYYFIKKDPLKIFNNDVNVNTSSNNDSSSGDGSSSDGSSSGSGSFVEQTNTIVMPGAAKFAAVNSTVELTATVEPANATNKNVIWSTSDSTKVSVSANRLTEGVNYTTLTCLKEFTDTVTITATSADNENIKSTCTCTYFIEATSFNMGLVQYDEEDLLQGFWMGDTYSFALSNASVLPTNSSRKINEVTAVSSDATVASIVKNEAGTAFTLTGLKAGTTNITFTLGDSGLTDICQVNVKQIATSLEIAGVAISQYYTVLNDYSNTITATSLPTNTEDINFTMYTDSGFTTSMFTLVDNGSSATITASQSNLQHSADDNDLPSNIYVKATCGHSGLQSNVVTLSLMKPTSVTAAQEKYFNVDAGVKQAITLNVADNKGGSYLPSYVECLKTTDTSGDSTFTLSDIVYSTNKIQCNLTVGIGGHWNDEGGGDGSEANILFIVDYVVQCSIDLYGYTPTNTFSLAEYAKIGYSLSTNKTSLISKYDSYSSFYRSSDSSCSAIINLTVNPLLDSFLDLPEKFGTKEFFSTYVLKYTVNSDVALIMGKTNDLYTLSVIGNMTNKIRSFKNFFDFNLTSPITFSVCEFTTATIFEDLMCFDNKHVTFDFNIPNNPYVSVTGVSTGDSNITFAEKTTSDFYLVGSYSSWTTSYANAFVLNNEADTTGELQAEYLTHLTMAAGDEVKINNGSSTWYGYEVLEAGNTTFSNDSGNLRCEKADTYTFYFKQYDSGSLALYISPALA